MPRPPSRDFTPRRPGSPRVVAGTLGGRRLATPSGRATRPTSERVREALFNSLAGLVELSGCRFADLYAGSGAVGVESLSRGASRVLFVESDPGAARVLRGNLAQLGLAGSAEVVVAPVARAVSGTPTQPYHVIFADPPYELADADLGVVLSHLVGGGWIAPDGVVVLERGTRSGSPVWVPGLTGFRIRRYGETTLWYGRPS
ncbi:MAG TPA: 16S rRNA (guanine(966)-N(2))-methyltransferase RsmD [Micromonosporaceae bacterium]|nr:16S rRNA (guanine(966)-N(2))-methyltransferase RsmD [Micromonosporaceae bacterium]